MELLEFIEQEELLRFFHCSKTELSCMENPHIFLSQLRDNGLIPEEKYQKVKRMKSKVNTKKGVYEILEWVERNRADDIQKFWKCVFREPIMNQYETLKALHKRLLDGSFHFNRTIPVNGGLNKGAAAENVESSENVEQEPKAVKKKRKEKHKSTSDAEEQQPGPSSPQPGPSSRRTPIKRKKPSYCSPLKKGEKGDIWTWPIYKVQLQVTCGEKKGTLQRERFAKGEECIFSEQNWFTPPEFEKFAGKAKHKNWKLSIQCMGTSLDKLIQDGHLPHVTFKRRKKAIKKTVCLDVCLVQDRDDEESEEGENEEDEENDSEDKKNNIGDGESSDEEERSTSDVEEPMEMQEARPSGSNGAATRTVFEVTCGDVTATLHKKRFASGNCGWSIRTETRWMTPVDFAKMALNEEALFWRKVIKYEGRPLSTLITEKTLNLHSILCSCKLCKPSPKDMDDQKNDDECCICKSEGEGEGKLVECDHCPRSFHQKCHLPHLDNSIIRDESQWMCTFCIYQTAQDCRYGDRLARESVLSHPIQQQALQCQYLVLFLCSADDEQIFTVNPSQYVENYSSFIETPMWLEKIGHKLLTKKYQTVGDFVSDVHLIFTNSATFNKDNAEFLAIGEKLKQLFEREFTQAFSVTE